jgi:hypothetical protein
MRRSNMGEVQTKEQVACRRQHATNSIRLAATNIAVLGKYRVESKIKLGRCDSSVD